MTQHTDALKAGVALLPILKVRLAVKHDPSWEDARIIGSRHLETIIAALSAVQALLDKPAVGGMVMVPEDKFVLCPKCEGKKGFNIPYQDRPHQAFWKPCADCGATGKILASRLALMIAERNKP